MLMRLAAPLLALSLALGGCAFKTRGAGGFLKDLPADEPTADTPASAQRTSSRAQSSTERAIATLERAGAYPITLYVYIGPGERAPAGVDVMALDALLAETRTTTLEDGVAPLVARTIALPFWRARFPGGVWTNVPAPQIVPGPDGMGFEARVFVSAAIPTTTAVPQGAPALGKE